ncbi:hypothetical protein [Streptomyces sp. NPDC059916]|uniref:hypothetical protein n=1 Tax=Streptomyces sp. NPDC059916 TaxID=3347001 RepID=UPI0036A5E32E
MSAPTMPSRRPVTVVRPRPQLPEVPFQGLFKEPEYDNGQPYADLEGPAEDDD